MHTIAMLNLAGTKKEIFQNNVLTKSFKQKKYKKKEEFFVGK